MVVWRCESERGVALVMVLTILVLVSSLSLTLATLTHDSTKQLEFRENANALYYAALQGEAFGMATITGAFIDNQQTVATSLHAQTHVVPLAAQSTLPIEIEMTVKDLQTRFNLAELVPTPGQILARNTYLSLARYCDALKIRSCPAIIDKAKTLTEVGSTYEVQYALISSLIHSGDINREEAALFSQNFTSLPHGSAINYNTAPKALLSAIVPQVSASELEAFVRSRQRVLKTSNPRTSSDPVLSALSQSEWTTSGQSRFFAIETTATLKLDSHVLQSVVHLDQRSGLVQLIYRRVAEFTPKRKGIAP